METERKKILDLAPRFYCFKNPHTNRFLCILGSRALPLALCKRPARLTWSACSKTPTCAPSTPSVWPSCQRIFSSPEESVANEPKSSIYCTLYSAFKIHKDYYSVSSQNLHIFSAPFTSKESTAWTFRLIIDLHPVEAIVSLVDLPSYRTSFFFSFFWSHVCIWNSNLSEQDEHQCMNPINYKKFRVNVWECRVLYSHGLFSYNKYYSTVYNKNHLFLMCVEQNLSLN